MVFQGYVKVGDEREGIGEENDNIKSNIMYTNFEYINKYMFMYHHKICCNFIFNSKLTDHIMV